MNKALVLQANQPTWNFNKYLRNAKSWNISTVR